MTRHALALPLPFPFPLPTRARSQPMLPWLVAAGSGRPVAVCLSLTALLSFVLPNNATVVGFLSAVGLGLGIGYSTWLNRATAARISSEKAYDEAHRTTTLAKLEAATTDLEAALSEHAELSRRVTDLTAKVESERLRNDALGLRNDALDLEMMRFAHAVLRAHERVTADDGAAGADTHDQS